MLSIKDTKFRPTYWERLKTHPGVGFGVMFPLMGTLAGASNKSVKDDDLVGVLIMAAIGFFALAIFCWVPILISNREGR